MHIPETRRIDYIEDRLAAEDRLEVERHLADCESCRRELVVHFREARVAEDEARLTQQQSLSADALSADALSTDALPADVLQAALAVGERAARPARWWPLAAVLAVAVLGGILGWVQQRSQDDAKRSQPGSVFRLEETPQTLELIAPSESSSLPAGPVQLRWTAVLEATEYRVWVLDASGVPLVEHPTTVNEWTWPGDPNGAFWFVEAQLEDGSRLESEARQLRFADAE
ncbi:MAG: zf-HC2 domain-containing protein [Acidobacteriota bacterium]